MFTLSALSLQTFTVEIHSEQKFIRKSAKLKSLFFFTLLFGVLGLKRLKLRQKLASFLIVLFGLMYFLCSKMKEKNLKIYCFELIELFCLLIFMFVESISSNIVLEL